VDKWTREGAILQPESEGELDGMRASHPWVVEDDGGLRMWYTGSDGTTSRILQAVQPSGGAWRRLGVAVDAGFAGGSDGYGVESPCVVSTPGGYLMAYAGSDGQVTRLHMATSVDGQRWTAQGTIMQHGAEDRVAATHPCLLTTEQRWWLFFSGYGGWANSRRSVVLAAVSATGASWDRLGPVLEPERGELAVSSACVLEIARTFHMFYVSEDGDRASIALATSTDGASWDRRGTTLAPTGEQPEGRSVDTPCVVRLKDGSLHMWYSALGLGDTGLAYRICSATFTGSLPT
jgi:predicted GH43/DUF377 family glycosyl hydrolase